MPRCARRSNESSTQAGDSAETLRVTGGEFERQTRTLREAEEADTFGIHIRIGANPIYHPFGVLRILPRKEALPPARTFPPLIVDPNREIPCLRQVVENSAHIDSAGVLLRGGQLPPAVDRASPAAPIPDACARSCLSPTRSSNPHLEAVDASG